MPLEEFMNGLFNGLTGVAKAAIPDAAKGAAKGGTPKRSKAAEVAL